MKIATGDLVAFAQSGHFDAIVHGCNCQCRMGAGIARQIAVAFPEAALIDKRTERGDPAKLGTLSSAWVVTDIGTPLLVINAYTQLHFGHGGKFTDYNAVANAFEQVAELCSGAQRPDGQAIHIGYPRIGAGLGGGDWSVISAIIDEKLCGLDHTLVNRG